MAATKSSRAPYKKSRTYRLNSGAGRAQRAPRSAPRPNIEKAIDAERRRLSRAQSVLGCLAIALDAHALPDTSLPDYADVANVIRDMMNTSIDRLDSVNLSKAREK